MNHVSAKVAKHSHCFGYYSTPADELSNHPSVAKPQLEIAAEGTSEPNLQIISVTQEQLEANFFSPTIGIGIHILSQEHSNGQTVQVSITSMNGETIFAVDRPIGSSQSILTIINNEFLMINETLDSGEPKLAEYAIPKAYSEYCEATRHGAQLTAAKP